MKKTLKIFSVLAAIALAGFGFISCSSDDESDGGVNYSSLKVNDTVPFNGGNYKVVETTISASKSARSAVEPEPLAPENAVLANYTVIKSYIEEIGLTDRIVLNDYKSKTTSTSNGNQIFEDVYPIIDGNGVQIGNIKTVWQSNKLGKWLVSNGIIENENAFQNLNFETIRNTYRPDRYVVQTSKGFYGTDASKAKRYEVFYVRNDDGSVDNTKIQSYIDNQGYYFKAGATDATRSYKIEKVEATDSNPEYVKYDLCNTGTGDGGFYTLISEENFLRVMANGVGDNNTNKSGDYQNTFTIRERDGKIEIQGVLQYKDETGATQKVSIWLQSVDETTVLDLTANYRGNTKKNDDNSTKVSITATTLENALKTYLYEYVKFEGTGEAQTIKIRAPFPENSVVNKTFTVVELKIDENGKYSIDAKGTAENYSAAVKLAKTNQNLADVPLWTKAE